MDEENTNKSNAVTDEEREILDNESRILREVLDSLQSQAVEKDARLRTEGKRARELTSQLVAATRDEDKAMLASDEAVSHALQRKHSDDARHLDRLLAKPYFARIVLREELNGKEQDLEYKLGFVANPNCRIIDWRKSPIAKIFYEYQEGDDFCEEVQGREREGIVTLRHTLNIEDGELREVQCRLGNFAKNEDGEWTRTARAGGPPSGGIKDVLPLITAEQFSAITENAETAVLIQGVAGSGKTTVALHRLAWLLDESNSEITADSCAVIVRSEILASYIRLTLEAIQVDDVPVYTFEQWTKKLLKSYSFTDIELSEDITTEFPMPRGLLMIRHAEEYFESFEESLQQMVDTEETRSFYQILEQTLLSLSSKKRELIERFGADPQAIIRYYKQLEDHKIAPAEEAYALVRYTQTMAKIKKADKAPPLQFKHLVVDELQDFSLMGLAALLDTVKSTSDLTLVGDVSQALATEYDFIGWERLKSAWKIELGEAATFFTLEVSHRSTLPIMQLASRVAEISSPKEGRTGRVPIWFHRPHESGAVESALKWLNTATERYANAITAVLCQNPSEALEVYRLLRPTFGSTIRLGKRSDFTFEEGIVVATIDDVKGLEFTNVLLWNPSRNNYPKGDKLSKNRLYVGMTRAEENLCLVTWGRYSALLPSTHSKLVRGYDFRDEYVDETPTEETRGRFE